jgi:hypothetical protein
MSPYICLNKYAYNSRANRANILKLSKRKPTTTTNLVVPFPNRGTKILATPMTVGLPMTFHTFS